MSAKKLKKTAAIDDAALNLIIVLIIASILLSVITGAYFIITKSATEPSINDEESTQDVPAGVIEDYPFKQDIKVPTFNDEDSLLIPESINSSNAILVDLTAGTVVASRRGEQIIYPASMTKVMTLIVIVENLKSEAALNEVLTISREPGQNSGYGFKVGEKLTVEDLIYAAILQSDGLACLTLADYIAGSEANFVKLMNDKATEMGLKNTVFQNCTGLHHQYHYSTCLDMATIMAYAMQNPLCAKVLSSLSYKPSDNFRPGDGCTFWHTLLHNHLSDGNTQPRHATLLAGKTGYTEKDTSGHCIVAYAKGTDGHFYVSVTAKAESWLGNVDDIISIFNNYVD